MERVLKINEKKLEEYAILVKDFLMANGNIILNKLILT